VGVSELRAMLSHLDINWCLTISNSIEINRLVCVTEARQGNLAIIVDHCSVLSQVNPFLLHVVDKYIFCKFTITKLKSET